MQKQTEQPTFLDGGKSILYGVLSVESNPFLLDRMAQLMTRIINWVPFHWTQSARQRPHYSVDNWSVLPFISTLNAIKYHYWLSNLQSALGFHCLLKHGSASQIGANAQRGAISSQHHTLMRLKMASHYSEVRCSRKAMLDTVSDARYILHWSRWCGKGGFIWD